MPSMSSMGIGSGLDIDSIVSGLMTYEQRPALLLQQKSQAISTQLSAFGQIKSVVSSLQDAARAFLGNDKYAATTAKSSDSTAISASSTSSALTGTYNVKVLALAQGERIATSAGATPSVGAGSLSIQLGAYKTDAGGNVSFTPAESEAKSIAFTGSTLVELRDSINAAGAGVTASIVNDGSEDRLVLASTGTGEAASFKLSGSDGLEGFSYDASSGAAANGFTRLQAAQDSKINVDGLVITRGSNSVTDAIPGVTLTLNALSANGASISVAKDTSQASSAVQNFVTAYNGMISTMKAMTSYDAAKKQASVLTGDSTVSSVRSIIRTAVTQPVTLSDGSTMRFSDIGVSLQKDGSLAVDTAKLNKALTDNPGRVAEFLSGGDSTKGLGMKLVNTLDTIVGTEGSLVGKTKGLQSSIDGISKQLTNWETRLTAIEARYRAQFTRLDTTIASMQQTQSYLTQQLASLPGMASSSK